MGGEMDIIVHGEQSTEEAIQTIAKVLRMFKERYQIGGYKEMHLNVVLLDEQRDEVELMDSQTKQIYRIFEVLPQGPVLSTGRRVYPQLRLVVDNSYPKGDASENPISN